MDPYLIHPREFAQRNGVPVGAIFTAVERGELPHVNGRLDPVVAQEAWDRIKAGVTHHLSVSFVGVEYLELRHVADEAQMTVAAHIRTRCGLPPHVSNRRGKPASSANVHHAFQRVVVGIFLLGSELQDLEARQKVHRRGSSLAQFIRDLLGYPLRLPLWPAETYERDVETEQAWDRLERLGLNPRDYLPEYLTT